jgi:predicted outer membrane repeat protein
MSGKGVCSMLRSAWSRLFSAKKRPVSPIRKPQQRLLLEHLEERCNPSVFNVTSLGDGVGATNTLRAAINNASTTVVNFSTGPGTITLDPGQGQLDITHNLTINGLGASNLFISGGNLTRDFKIESGVSVTINGVTIENGLAQNDTPVTISGVVHQLAFGGGINNLGTLTLNNSVVTNNQAADGGAGIDSFGSHTDHLTINNSTISNNTITGPTVPGQQGFGGGIASNDFVSLTNTNVTGNHAALGSGGIDAFGSQKGVTTLTINGGTFSNNSTAAGFGGAFSSNDTISISNATFSGNTAPKGGGAIDAFGSVQGTTSLTIANSNFDSNSTSSSAFGGAISTTDILSITGSTFTNNISQFGGGAVDYLIQSSNTTGSSIVLDNDTFVGNQANSGGQGGAVYIDIASVKSGTFTQQVTNSFFSNNVANASTKFGFGGGLDLFSTTTGTATSSGTVSGDIFTSNSAQFGGGLAVGLSAGGTSTASATLSGLDVENNTTTAGVSGVGPHSGGVDLTATSTGGVASATLSGSVANPTVISNNTTPGYGGGLGVTTTATGTTGSAAITVQGITVSGNTAGTTGGGVDVLTSSSNAGISATTTLEGLTVNGDNTAPTGAGVHIATTSTGGTASTTLSGSVSAPTEISGNTATGNGGGLAVQTTTSGATGSATTTVDSITVDNNTASGNGGNVYLSTGTSSAAVATTNLLNSTINGDGTTVNAVNGGGVYSTTSVATAGTTGAANVNLTNDTVALNVVSGNGGGVYVTGTSDGTGDPTSGQTFTSQTISGNHADSAVVGLGLGGGVFIDPASAVTPSFHNSLIAQNSSANNPTTEDVSGTVNSLGFNLVGNGDGSFGWFGTGDLVGSTGAEIDAMLAALANNGGPTETMAPQAGSPALNAGDPSLASDASPLNQDQTGAPRSATNPTIGALQE